MFLRYNLFGFIWLIIIFLLGLTPGESMPETNLWDMLSFDKLAHFAIFAILTVLWIIGLTKQYAYMSLRFNAEKVAVIGSIAVSLLLELFQAFIPGRSFEYYDMLANTLGVFLGLGSFYLVYKTA